MYYEFPDTWKSSENALIWALEMTNNATSKRIYRDACGPIKIHYFFPHLELSHLRLERPCTRFSFGPACFFHRRVVCFWAWLWAPWVSSRCVCVRVAPALAGRAAQRSMRLNKHGMAAGARSQGWGREEGMRLGGNKSKFLWNDLTGNDRVSALYNRTARERERAGEVLPKHRVVPDLSRWGWWNNKAFPVCVFH